MDANVARSIDAALKMTEGGEDPLNAINAALQSAGLDLRVASVNLEKIGKFKKCKCTDYGVIGTETSCHWDDFERATVCETVYIYGCKSWDCT